MIDLVCVQWYFSCRVSPFTWNILDTPLATLQKTRKCLHFLVLALCLGIVSPDEWFQVGSVASGIHERTAGFPSFPVRTTTTCTILCLEALQWIWYVIPFFSNLIGQICISFDFDSTWNKSFIACWVLTYVEGLVEHPTHRKSIVKLVTMLSKLNESSLQAPIVPYQWMLFPLVNYLIATENCHRN